MARSVSPVRDKVLLMTLALFCVAASLAGPACSPPDREGYVRMTTAMVPSKRSMTLGPGDVFVKGANALNYERKQAGVLIGHPTGGGVGAAIGTVMARRIRYLHPVGLEKSVPADLNEVAARINRDADGKGPVLWVAPGDIFTEIEALHVLSGVEAVPAGAGGIGGAEGAVWLALFGTKDQLDRTQEAIASVRGERPFMEA